MITAPHLPDPACRRWYRRMCERRDPVLAMQRALAFYDSISQREVPQTR